MKGQGIVKTVMAERKICKSDFFTSRFAEHVAARREAIERLRAAGLNKAEIGRVMNRARSTVRYWVDHEHRTTRNAKRLERYHGAQA